MNNKDINWKPWIIAGSVLLLLISSMSFFVSNNVYDSERFARKTTEAITSEPAREAIAREVSSAVLAEQSLIAKKLLSEPVEVLVSGLLKTNAFSNVFYEFSKSLNRFVTTRDFEPVTIDISSVVPIITPVIDRLSPNNNLNLAKFETNEIILLEDSDLPPFDTIGKTLVILGPLSFVALMGIAVAAWRKLTDKRDLLKYSGMVMVYTGVLLLVLTYTSGGLLTVSILDPERSIIMREIYNSFFENFRTIQYLTVALGGALWLGHYFLINDLKFSVKARK